MGDSTANFDDILMAQIIRLLIRTGGAFWIADNLNQTLAIA
jgi:hypothetical protein